MSSNKSGDPRIRCYKITVYDIIARVSSGGDEPHKTLHKKQQKNRV